MGTDEPVWMAVSNDSLHMLDFITMVSELMLKMHAIIGAVAGQVVGRDAASQLQTDWPAV